MSEHPKLPTIGRIAELLGGDIHDDQVRCPGPDHSPADRSLCVKPDEKADGGFVCHSFSGDPVNTCRDYIRQKLGLPKFGPSKKANGKSGGAWKLVREHVYRSASGEPHLRKRKMFDGGGKRQFPQAYWDGSQWVSGVPKDWPKLLYRLPELIAAPATNTVYVTEGERDADSLAAIGLMATTAGGVSSEWTSEMIECLRGRPIIVIMDADQTGRDYGRKVARWLHPVAKSVKLIDLYPSHSDGSDVSNFVEADRAGVKLLKAVKDTPFWEPSQDEAGKSDRADDELIAELAALPQLAYERRREQAAKQLGIRVSILDQLVEAARAEAKAQTREPSPTLYAHWNVEPVNEPVDGNVLLGELVETLRRYVVITEAQALVCALWIIFTWLHDIAVHSPILLTTSPLHNSGKTTLLKVISFLVRNGLSSVSITGAALFRSIEKWSPSFTLDEGDTIFITNDDLKDVVNSGWTRSECVIRCDPDTHEPRPYSTFCPKAIGMIGRKLAPATLSRCLIIAMQRKKPTEHTEDFDYCDTPAFAQLRSRLMRWAADNTEALAKAAPEIPSGFHNRVRANWRLLLAIAERAGGDWKQAAQKAAEQIEQLAAASDSGIVVRLLADIHAVFTRLNTDRVTTKTLISELILDQEGPWLSFGKGGKPITDRQLSGLLKDFRRGYGIKSKPMRVDGIANPLRGYSKADFEDDFASYLPSVSAKTLSASETTEQTHIFNDLDEKSSETSASNVSDKNGPNPLEINNYCTVSDQNPGFAETDNKGVVEGDQHVSPDQPEPHGDSMGEPVEDRSCRWCDGPYDGTEQLCAVDGALVWLHRECQGHYLARSRG